MTDFIIKGPVMIPGQSDRAGDRPMTPEEIQKAAYQFLQGMPIVDYQHSFQKIAQPIESYITPEETIFNGINYPAGTWFLTSNVTDPEVQKGITKGELTGYSVAALPEKNYDDLKRIIPKSAIQKGMFKDVDEGKWFPLTVSVVDVPCVPDAVFKVFDKDEIVKKSFKEINNMVEEEKSGIMEKLVDFVIRKADAPVEQQAQPNTPAEKPAKPAEKEPADPVAELTQKISDLEARIAKLEGVQKEAPAANDEVPVEKSEGETPVEEAPIQKEAPLKEETISKSLPVDEKIEKSKPKSFMERIGADARGRNKKYM